MSNIFAIILYCLSRQTSSSYFPFFGTDGPAFPFVSFFDAPDGPFPAFLFPFRLGSSGDELLLSVNSDNYR